MADGFSQSLGNNSPGALIPYARGIKKGEAFAVLGQQSHSAICKSIGECRFDLTGLMATLGLALYWPLFPRGSFSVVFSLYPNAQAVIWDSFSTVMLSLALFLSLGVGMRREIEAFVSGRGLGTALLGVLGTVGFIGLYLSSGFGEASGSMRLLSTLLVSLSYTALTFAWMRTVLDFKQPQLFLYLIASFMVSNVFSLVIYAPAAVSLAFAVLSPLASALLWFGVRTRIHKTGIETDRLPDCSWEGLKKLPLALVGVFMVFLMVGRSTVGLLYFESDAIPLLQRAMSVSLSCVILAVLLFAAIRFKHWEAMFQTGWAFMALIILVGMFMLIMQNEGLYQMGSGIVSGMLSCFEITLWVLLAHSVYEQSLSSVMVFGLSTLLVRVIPHYCGKFLIPAIVANAELVVMDNLPAVVVVMAFLLMATTVLFINARLFSQLRTEEKLADGNALEEEQLANAVSPLEEHAHELAEQSGLTPRETQVMLLMAQGFSYQKIADELVISLGTTQGHAKNVYRKLGVHTKQELIDVVRNS